MTHLRIWGVCLLMFIGLSIGLSVAAASPQPDLAPIAAGGTSCALRHDGRVMCWGRDRQAAAAFSGRGVMAIVADRSAICALLSDGAAQCRSSALIAFPEISAGRWRSIAANDETFCGIRTDGSLVCRGDHFSLAPTAPSTGRYRRVDLGDMQGCAIREDGTLACWVESPEPVLGTPPEGRFLEVSVGNAHACALRVDGRVLCWGWNGYGQTDAPTEADFIAVAVGAQFSCALRSNGLVACWGRDWEGETRPPQELFTHIAADYLHACGRKVDGTIRCWGDPSEFPYNVVSEPFEQVAIGGGEVCALDGAGMPICLVGIERMLPPDARYATLALGAAGGCGIRRDGRTVCWGEKPGAPPEAAFRLLSLGEAHACGLRTDGGVLCWGESSDGRTDAPTGVFTSLASGARFTCGLHEDGSVACWGAGEAVSAAPAGSGHSELVAGGRNVCVRRSDGRRDCWGEDALWLRLFENDFEYPLILGDHFGCGWVPGVEILCDGDYSRGVPSANHEDVLLAFASGGTLCVVEESGSLDCSGSVDYERYPESARIGIGDIALGTGHGCSLGADGLIACLGDDSAGQGRVPMRRARALSAEADHACAIEGTGFPFCWGDDARGGSLPPPGVVLRTIDVGQFNACGVRADGDVACWGWNINDQGTPPPGAFRSVATGLNHSCGIRDDGTLACWGYGADGQTAAPSGHYLAVDVGERHGCAIAIEGDVRCWGLGSEGQTAAPPGRFRVLASGAFHNCAIRDDGTIACWGRNLDGQAIAPDAGRYLDVSAGTAHSCAIADDGLRLCWGADDRGQAPIARLFPETLPGAREEMSYDVVFTLRDVSSSGAPPVSPRYRVIEGVLPAGLALTPDGRLHGRPWHAGESVLVIEARDEHGFGALRRLHLRVAPLSTQALPVVPMLSGVLGDAQWYRSDVRVIWNPGGDERDVVSSIGCEPRTITEDIADLRLVCTVVDADGERSGVVNLRRDATPPTLNVVMPPATLRANTVHDYALSASDAMSGLADASCTPVDTREAGVFTARCEARDRAGNTTVRTSEYRVVVRIPRTGGPQQILPRAQPPAPMTPMQPARPRTPPAPRARERPEPGPRR
jgi:alpha-tubulin suppressor-like RCC1 family protein